MRAARAHYENFPVASVLVPATMRPHVAAVYAFARAADDFADEGDRPPEVRQRLLDGWQHRLHQCVDGRAPGGAAAPGEPANAVEIFVALGETIRVKRLPVGLFDDLLSAFAQDVMVTRYATWDALLDYCRRSADPVGRLVLRIAGYGGSPMDAWSDAICTGLQLTNFWQDLKIDFDRGRIYMPAAELRQHGAAECDLSSGGITAGWRAAMAAAVARTRAMFESGRPLCDAVRGRLRYELRATWLGGMRILDRLERSGFDAVGARPSLGAADVAPLAWRMAVWARR
jgi:squalene synthase HpnC